MTPDDAPIPGFDRTARAARRGLADLATSEAPGELAWVAVQSGVRRVHRRRVTAIGTACAVFLLATGAAAAATARNDDHLRVNGRGAPPTTNETTTTPTAAVDLPTTTSTPGTTPGTGGTTTTVPGIEPPLAGAADLQGTISIPSTLIAKEATPLTLTVRNVSDHAVSLYDGWAKYLGVAIEGNYLVTGGGVPDDRSTLAAGEQVSLDQMITPWSEAVGPAKISAAFLFFSFMTRDTSVMYYVPGVPSVPIMVIPPGTVPGQPLDPSLGQWKAEMSADSTAVAVGDTVVVHVDLSNVGDQSQNTSGYGFVGIACGDDSNHVTGRHLVGVSTIAPGDTTSFSFELPVWESSTNTIVCRAGIGFSDGFSYLPRLGFESDSVTITILPAGATTTTQPTTTSSAP